MLKKCSKGLKVKGTMFSLKKITRLTEENNKIALISNDDKRIQSIDSIEADAYGTIRDLVNEKEEIKCRNITTKYKK